MNQVIAYAKLPLPIDIMAAQEEVRLNASTGKPHFNTAHYTGEWTVIALRSPGGKADTITPDNHGNETFADTELMQNYPSIKKLVQSFKCDVMSVRLLNLKRGALIKEHRDAELSFEKGEARLHFPLITNPQVEFYVEHKQVVMKEGECWYMNANLPHRVSNFGETDRVHLVIDCKVNEWLETIFLSAEITWSKEPDKTDELKMIIRELRKQNTETANNLASQMEIELNLHNA